MENIWFELENKKSHLRFCIVTYIKDCENDYETEMQIQWRTNQLESYYSFESEGIGWGSVSNFDLSALDLQNLVKGIDDVLTNKTDRLHYSPNSHLFEVDIVRKLDNFDFEFRIDDGLEGIWIAFEYKDISHKKIKDYLQPFYDMEKRFPVLSEKQLQEKEYVSFKNNPLMRKEK